MNCGCSSPQRLCSQVGSWYHSGKQLKNCTFIDFSCTRLLTEHNLSKPEQIGFWISYSLITLAYSPKCVSFKVIDACFRKKFKSSLFKLVWRDSIKSSWTNSSKAVALRVLIMCVGTLQDNIVGGIPLPNSAVTLRTFVLWSNLRNLHVSSSPH